MSRYISLRLALPVLMAAAALPRAARGQSQDSQSVAEAARRAREQKKAPAKPAAVITDDTLKRTAPPSDAANAPAPAQSPDAASASASQPAPQAGQATNAPAAPSASAATAGDAEKNAKRSAELERLKRQLADAQKALDLLQRGLALQQDTFYSNPAHDSDPAGKAKLDDMKQQIAAKQQEVEDLKSRAAALQESLGNTAPAAPTPPTALPQP